MKRVPSLNDLFATYIETRFNLLARNSITHYKDRLNRFVQFVGDRPLEPLLFQQYLSWLLGSGLCRNSAVSHYQTVAAAFRWLAEMGLIPFDPAPRLPRMPRSASRRKAMTRQEVDRLLVAIRSVPRSGDWRYAILCGWHTGLRLSDVALLKRAEVDLEARCIRRLPHKTRRYGKEVEIPVPDELVYAMDAVSPYPHGDPSYVSPWMAQHYLFDGHKTLSAMFVRLCRKAHVGKSFHSLRHGFVSRMLNSGVPPSVVRDMTGQSLRVLEQYSHVTLREKRKALGITLSEPESVPVPIAVAAESAQEFFHAPAVSETGGISGAACVRDSIAQEA